MDLNFVSDHISDIAEDFNEAVELTKEQKTALSNQHFRNLSFYGVRINFNSGTLYITSENTFKNWQYYAGFEYIEADEIGMIRLNGQFLAILTTDTDRVNNIFEILNNTESEK